MDYVRIPDSDKKPTLWDRCVFAYHAFNMKVLPDFKYVIEQIEAMQDKDDEAQEARESKLTAALDKLQPFEQSQIISIAGMGESWREQFDQVMLFVDQIPVSDQLTIIQYIFAGNRRVVTTLRFKQWMTNHAEAILDALPPE